ncbi:unnamed protein product [Dovyalis caffra]|uniref:Receptor-like serine/threonine-protein kinase n=1 Tax=Dovyalis caffra TaxID=77055 RepID=A0AAV1SSZ9_9ROSI|nr:unnamed protein product [Dovyalis caffra]
MASFVTLLLLLFLPIQPDLSMANITISSSLTTNGNMWSSPSGDFAFGFRQLGNSNLFLLSIWFNKIPARTIVWQANGNNPLPRGSKVELTASNLVLMDPKGLPIWQANPATTVISAAMLDTGNFVLEGNDSRTYIWETFKNPTDTILPTQILDLGSKLFSRLTETNYSKGRFELNFSNGSLNLNPIAWPSEFPYNFYYSSRTYNENPSESGHQLVFNESANIYIVKMKGEIAQFPRWGGINYTVDNYYRATLGFDGVFTQYSHPKHSTTSQGWLPLQSIPINMCTAIFSDIGSGPCGFNSYCSIQENRQPTYDCPPGYVFLDPNNRLGGCKPTFPQGCGLDDGLRDPVELYELRQFDNVDWPLNDYERLAPYNQTECEKSCLHDCSCAVAIFDGSQCWKKRLPLSNGRYRRTGFSRILFKVRKEVPAGYCNIRSEKEKPVLLPALLGSSAFLNVILLVVTFLILFRRRERKVKKEGSDPSISGSTLRSFTYKELEEATNGFMEVLGRGSFGIVYKGILKSSSRNVIAVKKLDRLAQEREREFRTEVNAIGKTHHKNLVRLLGYCYEGSHRLLIYEFMSNGTLANFLFTLPRPDWHRRIKIALGIARGLLYLHEECDFPIIHCDIKPQNILLDDSPTARISDFGLAKLLLSSQTRTHTMIRGTRGYVAPEWFKNVPVTAKVDVYSFGVLLLEIICCRRSVVMDLEESEDEKAILTDWAYDCYVGGRIHLLVDNDKVAMDDRERLKKWVEISLWCIEEEPSKRPTMKMVIEMLEGFLDVPLLQPRFPFSSSGENQSQW